MKKILYIFSVLILTKLNVFGAEQYYLSINEEPKYKKGFKHFDYVNPDARKGGILKSASQGTFDSFNPFILKGTPAAGIYMIYDTLMTTSQDEFSISYPLIAKSATLGEEWVKFHIDKRARFSDGKPIRAEDVKFSFDLLISKGSPIFKRYYNDVKNVEVLDQYTIKFNYKRKGNKELPLIISQLHVLPKHFWENKDFLKSDDVLPIGSGAYKIKDYQFGKFISYELDENYWAKDLNVNVGQNNFKQLRYDYYKDKSVIIEAFKAGNIDFILENIAKNWANLYKGKNFDNGNILKKQIPHSLPSGMQGFVFNLRNDLFGDIEVRKALNLAFDFEWTNKKLFYNQYKRTSSYFENSELKATGKPSKEELKLLNPFKDILPKEVFGKAYKPNTTKGDGNIRKELRQALKILKKQGWIFGKNKILQKDGKEFKFEILLDSQSFVKVLNPFINNLKKIGIEATLRVIDQVAYTNKLNNFEYDMIVSTYGASLSPGNELRNYFASKSAHIKGSRNLMGIESKAVDALIEKIVTARSRNELIIATKALDRVLTHSYLVIANWHTDYFRIAYWNKFAQPKISPKYGLGLFTWWIKEAK